MSAIDDIISAVSRVIDRLGEATSGAQVAEVEAGKALDQALALGVNVAVEGLTQVKDQLQALLSQVSMASQSASEVLATAQAVADST